MRQRARVQPPPGADLVLTLVAPPAEGQAGAVLAYTLRVTNRGPLRAIGVFVGINATVAPLLQSGFDPSASCVPGVLEADGYGYTCQFSGLASGDSLELRFEGWPIRTGVVVFDAMVGSDVRDAQPENNQVSASMEVFGSCDGAYVDVCIPSPPPDLDCGDVPYTNFALARGLPEPDPHGFDEDQDFVGCESAALRSMSAAAPASSIHPTRYAGRALFRTPANAAYCWLARTLAPENPVIGCWTPNDGFYATIQYARGFRGQAGYHARRRFEGLTPGGYPLLRFGQNFTWRCRTFTGPSLAEDCSRRVGKVAFVCRSRRTGLTCRNRHGHGFWLGRFRGYRLF